MERQQILDRLDSPGIAWSVSAFDIDSGAEVLSYKPDRALDTASVGKVFLLHSVLRLEAEGRLNLEEQVTRRPNEWMDNSGLWHQLQAGTLSIYDICTLIGAVSDNAATNTMCRRVGLDVIHAHTRELGIRSSSLNDIVRWPVPAGFPTSLSTGCATELSGFVSRLARNELLDAAGCDTLRRWLGAGVDCSMVASTFNFDPLAHDYYDRGLWLWNKTGTTSSVRADIGVLSTSESRVAYAVLANWERGSDHRDAAMDAMRDVGVLLRGHVQGSA